MNLSLSFELTTALQGLLFGLFIGLLFELFRTVRVIILNSLVAVIIEDVIFWLIFTFLSWCFFAKISYGGFSVFPVVSVFLGFFIFYFTLSRLFTRLRARKIGALKEKIEAFKTKRKGSKRAYRLYFLNIFKKNKNKLKKIEKPLPKNKKRL